MNYMVAGRDTVSSALTWFFWLLSTNPTAEAKIVEELKAIALKKSPSEEIPVFDTQELNKLVYLHGALCECLRLFPPVPYELKTCIEQDILPSGHTVHPKSRVLISLYAMGRTEEIWGKDCLEFKPERWVSSEGRIKYEPPYKFLAFNSGPRICLGREVAFTQMKLAVATLIYNYHFEVVQGHRVFPKNSIILHMKDEGWDRCDSWRQAGWVEKPHSRGYQIELGRVSRRGMCRCVVGVTPTIERIQMLALLELDSPARRLSSHVTFLRDSSSNRYSPFLLRVLDETVAVEILVWEPRISYIPCKARRTLRIRVDRFREFVRIEVLRCKREDFNLYNFGGKSVRALMKIDAHFIRHGLKFEAEIVFVVDGVWNGPEWKKLYNKQGALKTWMDVLN
ncbi:hypothetical protein Sjap_010538 [Stephania japonica]|uniref:Cytochrome P450 n=1 Tax=Stephania japonica TaxID=461633 RepID=A0AAP0JBN3_9MAGN